MEHGIIAGGALLGNYLRNSNLNKYDKVEHDKIQKELDAKHPIMWDAGRIVSVAISLCQLPHQFNTELGIPKGIKLRIYFKYYF